MVNHLNYKHLRYFYITAKEGSIVKAAEALHLSPQTISGQLSIFEKSIGLQLFERSGKRLILNSAGKLVFNYADDIFSLGLELQQSLQAKLPNQKFTFTVGVIEVIPKILAANMLESAFSHKQQTKLVCREAEFDTLMADLAINKIDLIISDRPFPPGIPIKAYNHYLGKSGMTFFSTDHSEYLRENFPTSLHQAPLLISSDKSAQKNMLMSWFNDIKVMPDIVAEFDDSALMKFFGQTGYGIFCTPSIIEAHVLQQYNVHVIGRTKHVNERYYAISPERKVKHPSVKLIVEKAKSYLEN